jgi:predicted acetyltransferase
MEIRFICVIPNYKAGTLLDKNGLKLERANFEDAIVLSQICRDSFNQESILQVGKAGGPKQYDDPSWHIYSMKEGVYHKILYNNKIIGAILLAFRGKKTIENTACYHWELVQIFIINEYKSMGVGTFAVKQIESWFPEMYKMTTGTPSFSTGNIQFYKNLGFNIIREEYSKDEDIMIVLFEKNYKLFSG